MKQSQMNPSIWPLVATAYFAVCLVVVPARAQSVPAVTSTQTTPATTTISANDAAARGNDLLGVDDQITVHLQDLEEVTDKTMRIGSSGDISLPYIGRVHAAGLSVAELEQSISELMKRYVKRPEVTVNRTEMRSQPVSVIGQVKSPGVHQLKGRKTLVELLSLAGGLQDDAGYSAKITRQKQWGRIPLASSVTDPTGEYDTAEVPLRDLLSATDPSLNIAIMPNDVITVPKAEMVYVIGEVTKPGGIVLGDQRNITVLGALSAANGVTHSAKAPAATILRVEIGSATRREIPVDLKAMLAGKAEDLVMRVNDILYIPGNTQRSVAIRALESALQIGTGVAILSVRP